MSLFLKNLHKSGHLDRLHMTICNVGSRKLARYDDYGSQDWGIFAPQLTIYGFDADADACEAANADLQARQINWTETHIPLALANSVGQATLYVTADPMCCSLYPPNNRYLRRFSQLQEVMNLEFTVELETSTLDEFCKTEGIDEIDFLQIDVQGAELQVLEGGSTVLGNGILACQVEVWFTDLYLNQPLFADVDNYLKQQGFTLFNLQGGFRHRTRSPIASMENRGQLIWGDGFYFRDLIREDFRGDLKTPEKILKLACIADILNYSDYTLELLEYLTVQYGRTDPNYNFAKNIIEVLSQFPELVDRGLMSLPLITNLREYLNNSEVQILEKAIDFKQSGQ